MYTITVHFQDVNNEPVSFDSLLLHIETQDIQQHGFYDNGTFYPPGEIKKITYREVQK